VSITATAPGKLVVSGDYAVLDGAPAVCAATDRRVRVVVEPIEQECCELEVVSSDAQAFYFVWGNHGNVTYPDSDPGDRGTMLQVVLQGLVNALPATMPVVKITIDSSAFYDSHSGGKLGLGSSAAVCVALTGALHRLFDSSLDIEALCFTVHSNFQSGKGSGVDVACSFHGGLIRFQLQTGGRPSVKSLHWPASLAVAPVWTGQSASTREMLGKLDAYAREYPAQCAQLKAELSRGAEAVADTWSAMTGAEEKSPDKLLDLLAAYSVQLQKLDLSARMGIFSEEHRRLQRRAAASGAVYKPSGAGGGDFGLAFAASPRTAELMPQGSGSAVVISGNAKGLEISQQD